MNTKKRISLVLLTVIMIVTSFQNVFASTSKNNFQTSTSKLEEKLQWGWEVLKAPSMVLVLEDGEIVYEKSFGYIDAESKKQWNEDSITNIGSVSKIFLTASILKLNQEEKLSLKDPVYKYIPEFKMKDERYKDITIEMLLNHTSGLPGTKYDDTMLAYADTNKNYFEKLIKNLEEESLKANPGEYGVYCNEGFILAQKIIENISNDRYINYLNREILKPMGIENVYNSSDENLPVELFVPYYKMDGTLSPREVVIEGLDGTGALSTNIVSLAKFGENILSADKSVLNKESIKLFTKSQENFGKLGKYTIFNGLGFDYVNYPFDGLPVFSKSGGTTEYLSQIVIAPEAKLTVVGLSVNPSLITNVTEEFVTDILSEKNILKSKNVDLTVDDSVVIPPEHLKELQGKYSFIGGALVIDLEIKDNELSLSMVPLSQIGNDMGTEKYHYKKDGTFWSENVNGKIEKFSFKNIDGKIFLIRHLVTDKVNYSVAVAQKLEEGQNYDSWQEKDASVWLKENINYNDILGLMDSVGTLNTFKDLDGYVSFVRQTPFKLIDEKTADSVNETARDAGKLILNKNNITFRGAKYISEDEAKVFDTKEDQVISIKKENKVSWFKNNEEVKIKIEDNSKDIRVAVFSQFGEVIFDSYLSNDTWSLSKGSYIMVTGKENSDIKIKVVK